MKYLGNRNLSKTRNRGGHLKKSNKKKGLFIKNNYKRLKTER